MHKRHVFHRTRGGRARWKSAPETLHTLNNHGDHVEHHDGHGTPPLAVVLALLRRLAFVVDQPQPRCGAVCQTVWAKLGRQRLLGERRRALCDDEALASMRPLCEALWSGVKTSSPLVTIHAS